IGRHVPEDRDGIDNTGRPRIGRRPWGGKRLILTKVCVFCTGRQGMRPTIPSTRTLLAFEAAAPHGSFRKAAPELSLTHSAICRQIAALEELLGIALFVRGNKGVILSETGERYWRQVAADLARIERGVLDLQAQGESGGTLDLAVLPSFAVASLIP